MKNFSFAFLLVFSTASVSIAGDFTKGHWIDLTYKFSEDTIYWPTADQFKKTTVFHGHTEAGFYYTAYNFSGAEHGGTHLDAPIHFSENRHTVDQIPIEQLIGPAVVIRINKQAAKNRNYQLSVQDILDWEEVNGAIEDNSIVLIDSGSGKYWPNKKQYMGTAKRGEAGVKELKFPGNPP